MDAMVEPWHDGASGSGFETALLRVRPHMLGEISAQTSPFSSCHGSTMASMPLPLTTKNNALVPKNKAAAALTGCGG